MKHSFYDVIVIGAGPAGMAAALAAAAKAPHVKVALIEREERIGGILKQCIHDGFGLVRFKERLTGPEYAWRYRDMLSEYANIRIFISTFVTRIKRCTAASEHTGQEKNPAAGTGFELTFTNPHDGVFHLSCTALISATGCRERTGRQVFIHGDRPSGIFTAGQAQAFINLKGYIPGKRFVILGSGDIGLIMARRLTLETAGIGGSVEGVYEVKNEPSGLTRNIVQCLDDYGIPLHLSTTVSRLHGDQRLEGLTVVKVDEQMQPISGTERYIPCDTLILSVGLIPENDILDDLAPPMDVRTKGPQVNQYMETAIPGLFSCGNALHVNDLVDYVSESGAIAGEQAAALCCSSSGVPEPIREIPVCADNTLLYQVPSRIVPDGKPAAFYFRSSKPRECVTLVIRAQTCASTNDRTEQNTIILKKRYDCLKPPEMERIELDTSVLPGTTSILLCGLEE